jgi:hypothetical protein
MPQPEQFLLPTEDLDPDAPIDSAALADVGMDLDENVLNHLFSGLFDPLDESLRPVPHETMQSRRTSVALASDVEWEDRQRLLLVHGEDEASRRTRSLPTKPNLPSSVSSGNNRRLSLMEPIFRPLKDTSSLLVEFYFKDTAQVYSVYDSNLNPFRSTVSRLWDSSRVIFCALQSMAAACLVEVYPQLSDVGQQMRRETLDLLPKIGTGGFDEKALLALLMVGGTAGWHNPQDLGVSLFNSCTRQLAHMASGHLAAQSNNVRFFQDSLHYWEMLLAYVVDDTKLASCSPSEQPTTLPISSSQSIARHVPHPWTGIARNAQILVQKVGRLVRSQRHRAHTRSFATQSSIDRLRDDITEASQLEAALLNLEVPNESEIVNPDDHETPVWHLVALAEAYCRVGLLQLYRVFPDVLKARLRAKCNVPAQISDALLQTMAGEDPDEPSRSRCDEWLTAFALKTLDLLRPIPIESGTRDFQPFLLVTSCSELRLGCDSANAQISLTQVEVSRARGLILNRLKAFLHCLPPRPIRRCIDIVEVTWDRMDQMAGEACENKEPVYWMDIMIEKGWETTMG